MNRSKQMLLASTACAMLAMGVTPMKAMAFDNVEWSWNNDINQSVDIEISGESYYDPSGIINLEKMQIQLGDVSATSTVTGVHNNPPIEDADGFAEFSETLDIEAIFDDNAEGNPITSVALNSPDDLTLSNGTGNVDNNNETVNLQFDISGTVPVINDGVLDAVDLPKVESTATAVGNNQTIESTVAVAIHDGQFLAGGFDGEGGIGLPLGTASLEENGDMPDGNTHTDVAALLALGGLFGVVDPAEVSATSSVSDILNATVESSATAVGNNMSIDVASATPGDAFALADVTQFSYANISADSSVTDVEINDYANMGGAGLGPCGGCIEDAVQVPIVSSVATAVGNNMSIKVNSPSLE